MMIKHPELSDIPVDTNIFFSENTPLREAHNHGGRIYEERPQQISMAFAVADAFVNYDKLCVEAPTGVGKSFAYLVPAICFALKTQKPAVITTETINLQEQLINKDIPILRKLMGREFSSVLAKGRSNYICLRRLELLTGEHSGEYLPSNSLVPDLVKIAAWAESTADGSLADLDFSPPAVLWQSVCCELGNCLKPKCKFTKMCHYWNARKSWEKANIIVANHALFLSDLKMKTEVEDNDSGVLPQYTGIVIDEAHQLETNAAKYLGTKIREHGIFSMLNRLYNPDNGRGLLLRQGEKCSTLRQLVTVAYDNVSTFFNDIRNYMNEAGETQKRVTRPNIVDDTVSGTLGAIERVLSEYIREIDNDDDYKQELSVQLMRCSGYTKEIFEFIMQNAEDSVYWIEVEQTNQRRSVSLNYSPLNVAEILKRYLFSRDEPVTLTSATLSVNSKLDFYKSRVGFEGKELILSTPFNYASQAKVFIPRHIPEQNDRQYEPVIAENIIKYIGKTEGKAFVLFTNYSMLYSMKQLVEPFLKEKGYKLLVQGDGLKRSDMIRIFKEDINSVIFGAASFWMGVDVPGEALSNVIVTKLPFSVPTEPIIEARLEKIKQQGGNPFMDYSLPEAVLKFKQGIGRLIRSKTDTGIIVVLDTRIITKQYGRTFLNSIPPCPVIIE